MAIDDNKVYGLTGAQMKELPGKIEAVKGLARELTTADYNWPTDNPSAVAAWQLPDGIYRVSSGTTVYQGTQGFGISSNTTFCKTGGDGFVTYIMQDTNGAPRYSQVNANGGNTGTNNISLAVQTIDNLTSNISYNALSARQGKVLNDKIGGDLSNLTTTDKTSIINAINEVAASAESGVVELTTADYDYPENNPDGIAIWKLASGEYSANGVKIYYHTSSSNTVYDGKALVNSDSTYGTAHYIIFQTNFADIVEGTTTISTGMKVINGVVLDTHNVKNNLTSTSTDLPLSAYQGKVLKDLIDAISEPTVFTTEEWNSLWT